jgi:hypothetical protein
MKIIKVSEIPNEAIRKAAEERKTSSLFVVAADPMKPTSVLYYLPWGAEAIDDGGTAIWSDSPDFQAAKTRVLTQPVLLRDALKSLRAVPNKKAVLKVKIGEAEVVLSKVTVAADGVVVFS